MLRVNTVDWSTTQVLHKLSSALQTELIEWQKYTCRETEDGFVKPIQNSHSLMGDSAVIIAAINLKKKLEEVIEKSRKANV